MILLVCIQITIDCKKIGDNFDFSQKYVVDVDSQKHLVNVSKENVIEISI